MRATMIPFAVPLATTVEASSLKSLDSRCAALVETISVPNTTIWFSEVVQANTTIPLPDNSPDCVFSEYKVDVDLCRVSLEVITSVSPPGQSSIEAWLPLNWNGRFMTTGNGGLSGCFQYQVMAYGASQGFATVGTNNGHNGTSGEPFYQNPAVLEDFAYRSIHVATVVGKEVSQAFYGKKHKASYYHGCSTGGRQGFKEAQDFPEDFDGILVGAPAIAFNSLLSWSASFSTYLGPPDSPTYLTKEDWDLVMQDVLKQCDGLDGHVDGVIEDPDLCQYRPEALLCGESGKGKDCLTSAQAGTVRSFFSDLYGLDGKMIHPRVTPGSGLQILGSGTAGLTYVYALEWFRYVVYNDTTWEPNFTRAAYADAIAQNPFNIETWNGDLSGAREAGTKILHWHGLSDELIPNDNSQRYYNHVSRTMGLTSDEMDDFYRYFRISGLNHCGGGAGAQMIGQRQDLAPGFEPENNIIWSLVRWVEDGVGPEFVGGLGVRKDNSTFTRHHCKYPLRGRYSGEGDPDKAESWECV